MSKELNVSESVLASFDVFDFSLDKVSYPEIYNRIVKKIFIFQINLFSDPDIIRFPVLPDFL